MERTTFSVLYFIKRTKINKKGECPIVMRITINGVRVEAYLKKYIDPALWDTVKGKAIGKTDYAKQLNLYLDTVRVNLMKIEHQLALEGQQSTAQKVLDRFHGKDAAVRYTLIPLFKEHNKKCRKLIGIDFAPATVERYDTCLKHIREFLKKQYKKEDIYLDEINGQFIEDLEFWYKTERKCSHNTTTKYLKNFKKIIRIALSKDMMKNDPFKDIKFHLDDVERDFLESHELKILIEKPITIPRLAQIRDIFVFCCFTGLAFSDVKQLTPKHITTDINGKKWIRKSRQKTKNMCNIPLMKEPLRIIEKYKDHPACVVKGNLLPVLSNQKMNTYIKEIGVICGFNKSLSTHTARHTFATFTLAHGVSIESIAKMLGHSTTKMTCIYAKVLDSTILKEMSRIESGDYKIK